MGNGAKIAIGVGVVFVVGLVALGVWGMGLYEDEVCERLRGESAIVERTGAITSCAQRTAKSGDISDLDTFVFDVAGPKGAGEVFVRSTSTGEDAKEEYQGILLVMNGEETLVFGERPPTK